jgi:hypothetical protein
VDIFWSGRLGTRRTISPDTRGAKLPGSGGLTYTEVSANLDNLSRTYNAAGRRTIVGGSYARTGLPSAVTNTTYNANNQLTKWGSGSLKYDYSLIHAVFSMKDRRPWLNAEVREEFFRY